MILFVEILKSLVMGIVEGITEWLPISSTGHLLLFDAFFKLNESEAFRNMFVEVIQLGAILAVVVLYFHRLNPFSGKKSPQEKKATWLLWHKIIVATIPGGVAIVVLKLLGYDLPDNPIVIAAALVVYGILFIIIERTRKNKPYRINSVDDITYRDAILIGSFQVLSIVPGTSRSGSTILSAMTLGVSRTAAADFSFFLAIPAMLGASGLEILSFAKDMIEGEAEVVFGGTELAVLIVGIVVSFLVSLVAVKFLMSFVRRHNFEAFGWYRIALGAVLIIYFLGIK